VQLAGPGALDGDPRATDPVSVGESETIRVLVTGP
jgi:hypothetical protein